MTIRQRIIKLYNNKNRKKDYYISIFDNTTEYNPLNFGFHLSDLDIEPQLLDNNICNKKLIDEFTSGDIKSLLFNGNEVRK